jgi:hypothetical protein
MCEKYRTLSVNFDGLAFSPMFNTRGKGNEHSQESACRQNQHSRTNGEEPGF